MRTSLFFLLVLQGVSWATERKIHITYNILINSTLCILYIATYRYKGVIYSGKYTVTNHYIFSEPFSMRESFLQVISLIVIFCIGVRTLFLCHSVWVTEQSISYICYPAMSNHLMSEEGRECVKCD